MRTRNKPLRSDQILAATADSPPRSSIGEWRFSAAAYFPAAALAGTWTISSQRASPSSST